MKITIVLFTFVLVTSSVRGQPAITAVSPASGAVGSSRTAPAGTNDCQP